MAEETAPQSKRDSESHPPRVNGPAFLVFGMMFVVLGLSLEMDMFIVAGALFTLGGLLAIIRLRRWEKVHGVETILPGGPPSASAQAAAEEEARAQESSAGSSEDPGTTSPDS